MAIGIGLIIAAYMIIQIERKRAESTNNVTIGSGTGKDNRIIINKMWRQKDTIGAVMVILIILLLVSMFIFKSDMPYQLLKLVTLLGMAGFSFLYIVQDDGKENEEDDLTPESLKVQRFLRLIDYREHPFSLALILFILVVLTFILSKHFGLELYFEMSGNPRYVMSLPSGMRLIAALIFACGFLYMIQHCDFLGIRHAKQGEYKLMQIHFLEIILLGAVFLIWLVILIEALFEKY
ncbi:hypothetical protein [Paenibacillus dakarensis]|uniref:hypothetical protein n=1 Tax=Paenibacillus dakarensis TaxID=1527293 RepID=UPI001478687E|nr:hypothetical protein [Paenibacillus dakarensis]